MSLEDLYKDVSLFVNAERSRDITPDAEQSNYMALIFGDILKHIELLSIVWQRERQSSAAFVTHSRTQQASSAEQGDGAHPLTATEESAWNVGRQLGAVLHVDLESIFIFTTILLDRMAGATEYYFGRAQIRWTTLRTSMRRYFAGYASRKGLTAVPQQLVDEIDWLADNVVKVRDLLVVHKHDKDEQIRLHLGTAYANAGSDEDAYFGSGIMYPTDSDIFPADVKPSEVIAHVTTFGSLWLAYLRANSQHRVAQRLI